MSRVRAFREWLPELGSRTYIDPAAVVIGRVALGDDVSIWPGAVLRGDVERIEVGAGSNIQDNAVLHVTHDGPYTPGGFPCIVGTNVTVGHSAVLHACRIGDSTLIGMGAIVLDGAKIADHAMIGAGALVSPGTEVGAGQLWLGSPARHVRDLTTGELDMLDYSARNYIKLKDEYLQQQGIEA
jgi:carbonic anhydrase/acetyltransferase-like protein (isoleucine patch superfamily)